MTHLDNNHIYGVEKSKQTTPEHYSERAIQPIEYIEANGLGFCEGNIIKYITRYKSKDGINDLRKAEWYLKCLIDKLEKEALNT